MVMVAVAVIVLMVVAMVVPPVVAMGMTADDFRLERLFHPGHLEAVLA